MDTSLGITKSRAHSWPVFTCKPVFSVTFSSEGFCAGHSVLERLFPEFPGPESGLAGRSFKAYCRLNSIFDREIQNQPVYLHFRK